MTQRLATGLLQDLATTLQDGFLRFLDRGTKLVISILEQEHFSTDVKTIGIIALGDICLMSETAFQPHLNKTMSLLVEAGKMSLSITDGSDPDQVQVLLTLRRSLVEAFLGIINGIKSPGHEQSQPVNSAQVNQHIQSMLFYVQGLLPGEQEVDSPDFAR